ncbi:MAG: molybdenum cofactor guanylyltransferase [bacterium]
MTNVTPYLIAGGYSRRMGEDKRWLSLTGEPLLMRSLRLLRETTGVDATVVADDLDHRLPEEIRVIHDASPGKGPLGGIVAALEDAQTRWIMVLSVDLPLLAEKDLLALLMLTEEENLPPVVTLSVGAEIEPLAALYEVGSREFWKDRLQRNLLALHKGIRELGWKAVEPPSGVDSLLNVNHPDEWLKVTGLRGRRDDGQR